MKVSDLEVGALLQPKKGFAWVQWSDVYCDPKLQETILECVPTRSLRARSQPKINTAPAIYLGKIPKRSKQANSYEPRHEVYCTALKTKIRVMPESWRNIIEIKGENDD